MKSPQQRNNVLDVNGVIRMVYELFELMEKEVTIPYLTYAITEWIGFGNTPSFDQYKKYQWQMDVNNFLETEKGKNE